MFVATIPNRNSPPAILVRQGYREDGKVKTRTLANLSKLPPEAIEAVRRALKGEKPSGLANELADSIIRTVELAHSLGIDIDHAIDAKHEYNKLRPHAHGGKVL